MATKPHMSYHDFEIFITDKGVNQKSECQEFA